MHRREGTVTYSASDLVGFLECRHRTTLDLIDLDTPLERAPQDEQIELIQDKGFAHEADYFNALRERGGRVVELSSAGSFSANLADTRGAMADGADIIYQAALAQGDFMGYADFLRRVEVPSSLGAWSYEVVDTKLAHRPKPKFMIQLAHYSELLTLIQGVRPKYMHLVFGNRTERSFRVADYIHYYQRLRDQFDEFLATRPETVAERCDHCVFCDWRDRCEAEWVMKDHLNQVANIRNNQIRRLRQQGIHTLAQLSQLLPEVTVPGIPRDTLSKLQAQAVLQHTKRETNRDVYEILPRTPGIHGGFDRLPPPDTGDLYFDMEGDPLHEGGLEYLFGIYVRNSGQGEFHDFWAHDRHQEKQAFGNFVDLVTQRLRDYPRAHIYHYAHYEPEAMKRLMSLHGIREAEIDQWLREGRFVDLYKVVREAIRVSEPRYSIKNLETFYMNKRAGEVTNAGASIVYYEKWRQTHDESLLKKIRDYNEDDCRSTCLLHDWLLELKQQAGVADDIAPVQETKTGKSERIRAHEARLAAFESRLLDGVPDDHTEWDAEQRLRAMMAQLLDFHRRAEKPAWWALYARADLDEEILVEDAECIAGLRLKKGSHTQTTRGATQVTYCYPEQAFKLRVGDICVRVDTAQSFGTIIALDEDRCEVTLRIGKGKEIPEVLSISTGGPIDSARLREALFRLSEGLLGNPGHYTAAIDFLRKLPPRIHGHTPGQPIIDESREPLPQIIEAVAQLDRSTLFIQGPPGAGKTHTGSHVIAELMERGHRVGVTSNSHKAIQNLLAGVEKQTDNFRGLYKSSDRVQDSKYESNRIENVSSNEDVVTGLQDAQVKLVAGTAWLFCDPGLDQTLDYLFVDEAGQVAVANLVAMATSARNIVLLGDQMQLGQPIQGVHPGETGLSVLEYLLGDHATIPSDRGVFLATTWRMHPDICRFISEEVYEGRLQPEAENAEQTLILSPDAHPHLRPAGLVYVPATHEGCTQRSDEEAQIVVSLYESLLAQRYRDREDRERPMTAEDILVVAPYNLQVNMLRRILPEGARVGTVDKFQGQEAQVVIISMATSSGETIPRNIEFLYSKNRLNVAISRARCLAILVASPALADIPCSTVEQMGLVNLMCAAMQSRAEHDR